MYKIMFPIMNNLRHLKSIFFLVLGILSVSSCSDDVEFSNPAFQGDRNNQLWRADSFRAELTDTGELIITGTNNIETVRLILPNSNTTSYELGDTSSAKAEYIDGFGAVFSTANTADESVTIYPERGEITITEKDASRGTFTGEFRFIAFDDEGFNPVGFSNGLFLKVKLRDQ
jgi:hypothetical protein